MPALNGSEWPLLCVVVRQTLGWYDPQSGGRKRSDWLSHSQLKVRTGRGSDAVCRAVDGLVRKKLIEVRDERGRTLASSDERRRSCSRLFYSLAPQLLQRLQPSQHASPVPVSRTAKAETTKETGTNYRDRAFAKPERSPSAKTRAQYQNGRSDEEGCGCIQAPPRPADSASTSTPAQPLSGEAERFAKAFQMSLGSDQLLPTLSPDDSAKLQAALEGFGFERLTQLTEVFLACDIAYIRKQGRTLSTFLAVLNVLHVLRPGTPR